MSLLNGASFNRLENAISASEMRQRVISNNIANGDTPNFKRSEVQFEEMLEQSMGNSAQLSGRRTYAKHIPIGNSGTDVQAKVVTDSSTVMNNNANNVDIDREMTLLAKNQLNYNFYIQQVNHEVKMMKTAITGGA
ncbi:flagellar basal-body rod protein FlgB [Paenibacillus phyllosphaerae]|uniref:Flagellar basal body rod protein FlgB n=1 Tax=Paenibacillus phyllosphaerae TaxID=274593 RepID=A0A7W5AV85_9BACL|nr:flagellar basal body rod protein FlgB [Paenibacillus phyllosphaerae]MBB3109385.1 flagellar basal-body rod protein FlgB [Paenibacillus phyllosphaerae]